jgi:hypothetical protein
VFDGFHVLEKSREVHNAGHVRVVKFDQSRGDEWTSDGVTSPSLGAEKLRELPCKNGMASRIRKAR